MIIGFLVSDAKETKFWVNWIDVITTKAHCVSGPFEKQIDAIRFINVELHSNGDWLDHSAAGLIQNKHYQQNGKARRA